MEVIKEHLNVKFNPNLPFFIVGLPKEVISKYNIFLYSLVIIKQGFLEIACRVIQNEYKDIATFNTRFAEYTGLKKGTDVEVVLVSNELKPIKEITPTILSVNKENQHANLKSFLNQLDDLFVFNKIVFKVSPMTFANINIAKRDTIYTISKEFTRINNPKQKVISPPGVVFLIINSSSMNRKEIMINTSVKHIVDLFEIPKGDKISQTVGAFTAIIQALKSDSFYLSQNVGIIVAKEANYDFIIFDENKDTQSSINTKESILSAFDNFVNFLNVHTYGEGNIDYASALAYVKNIIMKEKIGNTLLFVFNDGSQFVGEHPSRIIKELTNLNVQIYPVCFKIQENPISELFDELFAGGVAQGRTIEFRNIPQVVAEILSVINTEAFLRWIYRGDYD